MRCPSCGAVSSILDSCSECAAVLAVELSSNHDLSNLVPEATMNSAGESHQETRKSSTLIEFPGVTRNTVPEWRKELSERVREVHERRAREAARESANETAGETVESVAVQPQLELLPQAELPPVNPLVAAALKRIERAHRPMRANAVAVAAYAPAREEHESVPEVMVSTPMHFAVETCETALESDVATEVKADKPHNLIVVAPTVLEREPDLKIEPAPPPKRLIVEDDPALNYLDSISRTLRVDEITTKRASTFKRVICAVLDLMVCGLLTAPIGLAMRLSASDVQDPRAVGVMIGSLVVMIFLYLTFTIALTGRTLSMRLLSLRVIDTKTGLIPTGGQAAGRAFFYILSLATAGLGILFALISREGDTAHDHFTRTAVIAT